MHEALFKYIEAHASTPLSAADKQLLEKIFVPKKIKKHQFIQQPGEISRFLGFVVKGALRQYSVDTKGFERMVYLSIENWWTGDRESFTKQQPSIYYIDAWEDSDLLTINSDGMKQADGIKTQNEIQSITLLKLMSYSPLLGC